VIVGAGAVGASLAAQLADCDANRVFFAAGGERLARLQEEPLVVNGEALEVGVLPIDSVAVDVDLLILTVKAPQLAGALGEMERLVGEGTTILSLLNGIESEAEIAAVYGWGRTLYGFVVGIDATRSGRQVRALSRGRFVFGRERNAVVSKRVAMTKRIFKRAGVACEVPVDMMRQLWWKFMVNVGINPLSAILRAPYGVFQECAEARSLMEESIGEVLPLARAEGVGLDDDDVAAWQRILKGLDPMGKTSMLQDVEAGRETEVDIFCGAVSRLGRKHGVATPLNDTMGRMIRAIECGYR
jgi:2-dehydropantoate 2-reductase